MKIYVQEEYGRKSETMVIFELRNRVARKRDDLDKLNQRIEITRVTDGVGDVLDVVGTDYDWTLLAGLNISSEYNKRKTPPGECSSPTKKIMGNISPEIALR
jgi:hypothetical protein